MRRDLRRVLCVPNRQILLLECRHPRRFAVYMRSKDDLGGKKLRRVTVSVPGRRTSVSRSRVSVEFSDTNFPIVMIPTRPQNARAVPVPCAL